MAAFSAANSLLGTLNQLENTPNNPYPQTLLLRSGVNSVRDFLLKNRDVKTDFENKIRDAIYEAEDLVDSHFLSTGAGFLQDIKRVMHNIYSLVDMMTKKKFNHQTLNRIISDSVWKMSDKINCIKQYPIVGRRKDYIQLKDRLLTIGYAALQVVPILGIAGMGKTVLARSLFRDPALDEHFHIRVWVKVPIEYQKRDVVLALLRSMKRLGDDFRQMTDEQLEKHLYNSLRHKRYLIILDDIRDYAVWNDLKNIFPYHNNGSRIMLTTRDEEVARAGDPPHILDRLTYKQTMQLLGHMIMDMKPCPTRQLADIMEDIAASCRGLPLAIVITARLLLCAELSAEYWEIVRSSINTCGNDVELIETVVSLTYMHLPQQLKPCLLYMAMFPYDYGIPLMEWISLWAAEGFIERSTILKEMEIGEACGRELCLRGLISFQKTEGGWKTCRINEEVFHDFLVRKAEEDNFFLVINKDTSYAFLEKDTTYNQPRRLCIHNSSPYLIKDLFEYNYSKTFISTVRSLLYSGPEHAYPLQEWLDFKLLRVLNALKIRFYTFPPQIFKSVRLRYLAFSCNEQLPTTMCNLLNLQVLIVLRHLNVKCSGVPSYLPADIWNMKELKRLKVMGSDLPEPRSNTDVLVKLVTLSDVSSHSCTPRIFRSIRSLGKLGVRIESSPEHESLSFFGYLDILVGLYIFKCVVLYPEIECEVIPCSILAFPSTLGQLILSGCGFPWEYMSVIATLPNLRKLKLQIYAFQGPMWEVKKDKFPSLELLLLEDMDLENWTAASGGSSFRKLECLIIRHCYKLREIPSVFADSSVIKMLEVVDCSISTMNSAQQIKKKQLSRGNKSVQFDFYSSWDD